MVRRMRRCGSRRLLDMKRGGASLAVCALCEENWPAERRSGSDDLALRVGGSTGSTTGLARQLSAGVHVYLGSERHFRDLQLTPNHVFLHIFAKRRF